MLASDLLRVKMPSNPRNAQGRFAPKYCTALDVMNGQRVRVFRTPGRNVTTPNAAGHTASMASYMSMNPHDAYATAVHRNGRFVIS